MTRPKCPDCKVELQDNYYCPKCGYNLLADDHFIDGEAAETPGESPQPESTSSAPPPEGPPSGQTDLERQRAIESYGPQKTPSPLEWFHFWEPKNKDVGGPWDSLDRPPKGMDRLQNEFIREHKSELWGEAAGEAAARITDAAAAAGAAPAPNAFGSWTKGTLSRATQAASSTGLSKTQLAVVIAIITLLAAGGGAVLMQGSNPLLFYPLQRGGGGNAAAAPGLTSIKMEGLGGDIHTIPVTVSGNTVSGSATWPKTSKTEFEYRASFKGTIEGSAIMGTITLKGRDPNPYPYTNIDYGPWSQSVVMPISGNSAASGWMHVDVPVARTGYVPIPAPDSYDTLSVSYRLSANLA